MTLRSDLALKYYLGLHQEAGLQDEFTVLFSITQFLIKAKQKEFDPAAMKFSSKSLKYVFGDRLKDETFKQIVVKNIKSLISQDFLEVDGDFLKITKKGLTNFYVVE